MAEFLENSLQNVTLNNPIIFENSIPCNKGYVWHEDNTGVFTLRGIVNNSCCGFARYQVTFNGNVSIPTGGDITPIAVSIATSGENRPTSTAIFTPSAVDQFGNVTSTAIVNIPRGCCATLSVRYVSGVTDGTTIPTPSINVQNANLVINRIA